MEGVESRASGVKRGTKEVVSSNGVRIEVHSEDEEERFGSGVHTSGVKRGTKEKEGLSSVRWQAMEEVEWPASGEKRGLKVKREESEKDNESVWKRREDKNPDLIQSGDCPSAAATMEDDDCTNTAAAMEEDSSSGSSVSDLYWPLRKLDFNLSELIVEGGYLCLSFPIRAVLEERDRKEFLEAISNPDLEESLSEELRISKDICPHSNNSTTLARIYRLETEGYLLSRGVPSDSKLMQYVRRSEHQNPLKYCNRNVQRVFEGFYRKGWSIRSYPEFDCDDAVELYRRLELNGRDFIHDSVCDIWFRYEIASYKGDKQYLSIFEDLLLEINTNTTYVDAFHEAYKLWEIDPVMPAEMVEIVATDALYQCFEEDRYKKDWNSYFELWTQVVRNKVGLFNAWLNIYGSEWDSDKLKEHLEDDWHQRQVSAILSIGDEKSDEEAQLLVEKIVHSWHDLDQEKLYASYLRSKLVLACTIGIVPLEE